MADIFISYSKKDADEARLIAALLEAQGYSVWWDTSLETGDEFRQEITEQLDAAKAVIVLWTENSVKSVWVNAEASRAHSDRKLVPLKARLLPGDAIPLPFSELHTTNFDNHEAVLAAVKTQLAKAPAPPVIWKKVRYEALTWFGIVGGTLTLVGHWTHLLTLSYWMRSIIEHWTTALHHFWATCGGLLGVAVSKEAALALSFFAFQASITFSTIARYGFRIVSYPSLDSKTIQAIFGLVIALGLFDLIDKSGIYPNEIHTVIFILIIFMSIFELSGNGLKERTLGFTVYTIFITLLGPTLKAAVHYRTSFAGVDQHVYFLLVLFFFVLPIAITPPAPFTRRLLFMLVGVALILGLSGVSRLVEHFSTAATQAK